MDAQQKLKKATDVLRKFEVQKNLEELINRYHEDCREVIVEEMREIPAFKKVEKAVTFSYRENEYTLIIRDMQTDFLPDYDSDPGDFILQYNGATVLQTLVLEKFTEWGSTYSIMTGPDFLKKLLLEDWIEELPKINSALKAAEQEREAQMKEEDAVLQAKNIDLGKY